MPTRVSAVADKTVGQDIAQEVLVTTALKKTDWKCTWLPDKNILQILEYLALDHQQLTQMVEESKIDKRFFREMDVYWTENAVLLRECVQHGHKVSQLVVPKKLQIDMFK